MHRLQFPPDTSDRSDPELPDSLFNVLAKLPEDTLVYPGRDFKGWTLSTIGEEKHFNPYLLAEDIEAFLELKEKQEPADAQALGSVKKEADTSAPGVEDSDNSAANVGNDDFYIPGETRSPDAAAPQKHAESEAAVKNMEATEAGEDKPAPLDDVVDVPSWR